MEMAFLGPENLPTQWYWIVGPNYDDCAKEWRVLWNGATKLGLPFDHPGTYNDPITGNMRMSLWGGKFIVECKSAQYPNSLDGEGLDGVLMVEAAKLKSHIFGKYIRPAIADKRGWSLWLSTPEGRNFFYDLWMRGQDPQFPTWASWRMPSWANSVVFPGGEQDDEIQDMMSDMSEEWVNQEIRAKFTDFVGLVFKTFDEEIHVRRLHYDPRLPLYGCCDFGWSNPFVWLACQIDVFNNIQVLGEYRVTQTDINDVARDLADWPLATGAKMFYPDPSEPGDARILSSKLRVPFNSDTGGPLKHRLEYIRRALKVRPEHGRPEDQRPQIYIDTSCTGLIDEMGNGYRYPSKKSEVRPNPEEPIDKDNHGPEALGRLFRGHFGPLEREGERPARAVVRTANIRSR